MLWSNAFTKLSRWSGFGLVYCLRMVLRSLLARDATSGRQVPAYIRICSKRWAPRRSCAVSTQLADAKALNYASEGLALFVAGTAASFGLSCSAGRVRDMNWSTVQAK
jgi:hypothetical protein